jgi:hypothetical protein
MVQGLIWISSSPNGFKQRGQDIRQLAPLVWIASHRLQIRIGVLDTMETVGSES